MGIPQSSDGGWRLQGGSAASATQCDCPNVFSSHIFWHVLFAKLRLFFYEASHPPTTFSEIILPNLERTLSLTLQHYLPLAGNQIWPKDSAKPVVQYVEGDAVLVTAAESHSDFYRLSSNNFLESNEVNPYLPYLSTSDTRAPVMALQVTLFPKVGFSIDYVTHHGPT